MDRDTFSLKDPSSFASTAYIFILLFLSTEVSNPLKTDTLLFHLHDIKGDVMMQFVWIFLYLIGIFFIVRNRKNFFSALKENILLILLIGFVLLSTLWSSFPEFSFRRGVALFLTTMMGIHLGTNRNFENVIIRLSWVYALVIFLCVFILFFFPDYGTDYIIPNETSFKGIFVQKNRLGFNMVLCFIVWSWIYIEKLYSRKYAILFMALSVFILFLSDSLTSILIFSLLFFLFLLFSIFRHDKNIFMGISSFFIAIILFAFIWISVYLSEKSLNDFFINILGRDITLSSRTLIWKAVWTDISKKFLFGYGYNGYWVSTSETFSFFLGKLNPEEIAHAHNGLLEVWLSIGLTGVILFLSFYIQTIKRLFQCLMDENYHTSFIFFIFFILVYTLYNTVENHALNGNSISWLMFVAVSVNLGRTEYF